MLIPVTFRNRSIGLKLFLAGPHISRGIKLDLYRKGFVIVVVALLALALYWMLAPFLGAITWGIGLAFLLAPLHGWLTRKLKGRAGLSAGIITALVPVLLAGPLVSIGMAFAKQVADLVTLLQQQDLRFDATLVAQLEEYRFIGALAEWLRQNLTATAEQLQGWLFGGIQALLQTLAATSGNLLLSAVDTIMGFFVMLFLLFFLLRDGRQLLSRAVHLVPMEARHRDDLLELLGNTTRAVVYGTVLTAFIQGALIGVGFAIVGLPSAVVFGVLAAFLALLPVTGVALIWVPATVFLASDAQWGWMIFMLIWGSAVSVSDNLLRPILISNQAQVSIVAVFIGVIGGVSAFGVIGVIIGPVLLTFIAALLRFADEKISQQT